MNQPQAALHYGAMDAGKTRAAISSFWDFEKHDYVPGRTGYVMWLGQEFNPAIADELPDEAWKAYPAPTFTDFAKEIADKASNLGKAVRSGKATFTDIVFDGITEFGVEHVQSTIEEDGDMDWEAWGELKSYYIRTFNWLHPQTTGINLHVTARLSEPRQPDTTGRKKIPGDPKWMREYEHIPDLSGWAKVNLLHSFNFIIPMWKSVTDIGAKGADGKGKSARRSLWLPNTHYLSRNVYEEKWRGVGLPHTLDNFTWPDINNQISKFKENK